MKIKYRKLGREQALGQAHSNGLIEIDERLRGKRLLATIIHEILHVQNPEWTESKVEKHSSELGAMLWKQHYRKMDL